jgi:DNA-binding response OmpR family regulator
MTVTPLTAHRPPPRAEAATAPAPELVLLADRRVALVDERPLRLTRLEYDLLRYLADNGGRVLPQSPPPTWSPNR